ncbi:MAG TPA: FecR domain-containing protein [Prolixibacteraceae bacterium]|jgi:ferric-dicitrate binding protein FerR (iron transport regulator)
MDANQNMEEEKWAVLAKSIYDHEPGPTSDEQNSRLDDGLVDSMEKEQLQRMTRKVDLYFELKKYPADQAWEKVQQRIHNQSQGKLARLRSLLSKPLMRLAAAIVVTALLALAGYDIFSNWGASGSMIELSASNLGVKNVTLPDGTLVSLNAHTHLKYPKRFARNTREVSMEGEAFFEVRPDKSKPFIIHARNAQIKVLGTSFNVNAYPNEKSMEVIVKTGRVELINKAPFAQQSNELILNPGDKGTLVCSGPDGSALKSTNADPNFLAWKTRILIFRATPMDEVIRNLEKVYQVKIRLADPKLNGLLLTAHFNDYSLDFILKVLESTFQMETQKMDGQYILKQKEIKHIGIKEKKINT